MQAEPIILPANQPADRFYAGGARIAELRGTDYPGGNTPEDWVASTTCLFGETSLGLTRLPSGDFLADVIAADPGSWLGRDHVERWGSDTKLLTKLLDAGQRLPVHVHPDGAFAREHLGHAHGKTEAWLVLRAGTVHLGFRREVSPDELADLVDRQETAVMLDALHAVKVEPGDAVLVPAGFPHAIGDGILLVEVQEPEDLSILLEWEGFALDPDAPKDLGLGMGLALQATDLRPRSLAEIESLVARRATGPALPEEADPYFRADWVAEGPLNAGFGVLVVLDGEGALEWPGGSLPVRKGNTIVVPHSTPCTLTGSLRAVWCRPPAATAPEAM
ncbi:class I mannose-6-phosphate isomerase [Tessaracoccus sp. OS52]|uniref:class I mannose-6-phosphate isomerase n=1 Tax=Tessaracoccus sp. OS52 TaxID=2886691 RepID=UPI001D105900|nr:class I mannose-6-phosphate isomerase [Tessaracoccus sp. OS52]MCC2593272.1 class I mannose-6-phosphate isomerase [Tessaracoccus sp. OS52]